MAVAKPTGGWTYEELRKLPDDGKRHELVDGELYELPAPNEPHQRASRNIVGLVLPEVTRSGAQWYHPPTDVFLPPNERVVKPDLVMFLPGGSAWSSYRGVEGAPDLLIEILSPSNSRRDLIQKRRWYAEAGAREYWVVSPEAELVEVLLLEGGEYRTYALARGDELVTSLVLAGLSFPAGAVFA